MHNNGTTPLILPDKKRLMPDLQPEMGVKLQATPAGVLLIAFVGAQELPIMLPLHQATQLGVNLISAAALLANVGQAAPQIVVPDGAAPQP